jgi:23S rRNA pseudouridine1911/1915/1917 synthase
MNIITVIHVPDAYNPYLVIYKPAGLPSAPLKSNTDDSAYAQAVKLFPFLDVVSGRKQEEHGMLHRIDTSTRGLLLIASTQESYEKLLKAQLLNKFEKTYHAKSVINKENSISLGGFPPIPTDLPLLKQGLIFSINSLFRPYGNRNIEVRPVTEKSGTAALKKSCKNRYITNITVITNCNGFVDTFCTITAGYRHQVRCHLAWIGIPILGDILYNSWRTEKQQFCFEAFRISFPHPLTGEKVVFEVPLDQVNTI